MINGNENVSISIWRDGYRVGFCLAATGQATPYLAEAVFT